MKKIKIKCGEWSAVLLPEYGMNTVSLRHGDTPILREPNDDFAFVEDMLLYGIPVLLPANRTHGAGFEFEGRQYKLPLNEPERGNNLHGSLYKSEFEVLEASENTVKSRIVNSGEHYPFDFILHFTDTVTSNGYLRELTLTNDGDLNMPYTFALHSTFDEPPSFSVPVGKRFEWDGNYIPTGEMQELDLFEQSFNTSCTPDGREISAPYTSCGTSARLGKYRLTVSENFDEWVFYNGNGREGYLCVEPQCGEVDGLNRPLGRRVLTPGESVCFTFRITVYDEQNS